MSFSIRVMFSRKSSVSKVITKKEWECFPARKVNKEEINDKAENSASASTNEMGQRREAHQLCWPQHGGSATLSKSPTAKAHMVVGKRDGRWRVIVMQPEHSHPLLKENGLRKHWCLIEASLKLIMCCWKHCTIKTLAPYKSWEYLLITTTTLLKSEDAKFPKR